LKKGKVTLLVFSGRPDPAWIPGRLTEKALEHYWQTLDAAPGMPEPAPDGLGYRGFLVETGDDTWFVFRGMVSRHTAGGKTVRADHTREVERTLLLSAPAEWQELTRELLRTELGE
jgi:hypothetical protein